MKALVATLLLSALATTAAAGQFEILEDALETDSVALELPASNAGTLWITGCASCPRFALNSESKFYVGQTEVSLVQLKQLFTNGTPRSVVVYFKPRETTVTRVVASK